MHDPRIRAKTVALFLPCVLGFAALAAWDRLQTRARGSDYERRRDRIVGDLYAQYGERWGWKNRQEVLEVKVVVPATEAEWERYVSRHTRTHMPLHAGFYNPDIREIAIRPGSFSDATLRHELVHAILDIEAAGNLPRWLHEGLASALETPEPLRSAAQGTVDALWGLTDADFRARDESRVGAAYALSEWWVRFLMERFPQQFDEFVRRALQGDATRRAFGEVFSDAGVLNSEYQNFIERRP